MVRQSMSGSSAMNREQRSGDPLHDPPVKMRLKPDKKNALVFLRIMEI
jgi:hypothetical protein